MNSLSLKSLLSKLTFRNALYFLLMIPLALTVDIGISVIEVSDLSVAGIILLWILTPHSNNKKGKRILKNFRGVIKSYFFFMLWCLITISISYFTTDVSSDVLLMFARLIKINMYTFICYIFITESAYSKKASLFIIYGFIFGHVIIAPYKIYHSATSEKKIVLKHTESDKYLYSGIDARENVMKNSTANIVALISIFLISLSLLTSSIVPTIITIPLLVLLYFLISRSSWLVFYLGLLLLLFQWYYYKKNKYLDSLSNKSRKTFFFLVLFAISIFYFSYSSPFIKNNLIKRGIGIGYTSKGEKKVEYIGLDSRIRLPLMAIKSMRPIAYIIGEGYYCRFYNKNVWNFGAHNQYVQFLWEIGIIGLVLFFRIYVELWKLSSKIKVARVGNIIKIQIILILISGLSASYFYSAAFFLFQLLLVISYFVLFDPRIYSTINKIIPARNIL